MKMFYCVGPYFSCLKYDWFNQSIILCEVGFNTFLFFDELRLCLTANQAFSDWFTRLVIPVVVEPGQREHET